MSDNNFINQCAEAILESGDQNVVGRMFELAEFINQFVDLVIKKQCKNVEQLM